MKGSVVVSELNSLFESGRSNHSFTDSLCQYSRDSQLSLTLTSTSEEFKIVFQCSFCMTIWNLIILHARRARTLELVPSCHLTNSAFPFGVQILTGSKPLLIRPLLLIYQINSVYQIPFCSLSVH